VRVLDTEGRVIKVVEVDGEADMSEYMGKGYELRLFFLRTSDLAPLSMPFER